MDQSNKDNKDEQNQSDLLYRLVNYAKDYINLVNPSVSRYKIYSDYLPQNIIDLSFLFDGDEEPAELAVKINLENFYKYTPKELIDLDDDTKSQYEKEKKIALKIEEIAGKFKINEYTKQIVLNFGFFTAEYPKEEKIDTEDDETTTIDGQAENQEQQEITYEKKTNPLFSVPVEIVQDRGIYEIRLLDQRVTTNFGFLVNILLEKNYFEFIAYLNELETDNKLNLPINPDTLLDIWTKLKSCLRLSDAVFDDESFSMESSVISLSAKSNYFLAQDLNKLQSSKDATLLETSLASWIPGLNDLEKLPTEVKDQEDIFFPFDHNKYQRDILKLLPYKASIVEGPPGTGKSQTIANLLCHLAANNKKVLFLSQKPQALKVVKDKLRDLDIKYLFGYIPDRYSSLYSDQEEADSAGSLLAGVSEYLNLQEYPSKYKAVISPKDSSSFSDYISTEYAFTQLFENINRLDKYDIGISNYANFVCNFNEQVFNELLEVEKRINTLKEFCTEVVSRYDDISTLNNTFNLIDFTKGYTFQLDKIIDEISKSYYDRNNKLARLIVNKISIGYKIKKFINILPGELVEYLGNATNKEVYKSEVLSELNKLKNFFAYKESLIHIDMLEKELKDRFQKCALNSKTFNQIKNMVTAESSTEVILNCIELYKLRDELKSLKLTNPNLLNKNLTEVRQSEKYQIRNFIRNRIKKHISEFFSTQNVKSTIAKIARSLKKSKRAYKTFDSLKSDSSNFITVSELIPIWIMSLEDASRLVPLIQGLFDYIVLDEASQCNLAYAIPAMYRTKHILFFGDSEQMRDDTIRFKSNQALQSIAEKNKIPENLQIKGEGDSVKSVLDIGYLAGFEKSALLNHYRSPREIIGFSNKYFYAPKGKNLNVINSNYLPYKDTNRVLMFHKVETDRSDDEGSKSNLQEALYIKKLINDLKSDPKSKDKSIGVLTFFNEQALLLKNTIEDPDVKVSIIEGIQGDERDIIIFSFVISDPSQKKKYIALTSEGGDINKSINEGRVNVAFSRARLQVHCVSSLDVDRWPEGIWIKKYLEYVEKEGEINFFNQELMPFDSLFEEEFYYSIRSAFGKNYMIQNQVESCGFKIDFVITNVLSGQKLAIECDGPTHFEDEDSSIYVESDLERQSVLESAGWVFYRVPYSRWIIEGTDRSQYINEIKEIFNDIELSLPNHNVTTKKEEKHLKLHDEDLPKNNKPEVLLKQDKYEEVAEENIDNTTDFKELFRFELDNQRYLVVSEMNGKDCIWINEFLSKDDYSGFTNHGIGIKYIDLQLFIENAKETLKTGHESRMPWKTGKSAELVLSKAPSVVFKGKNIIDLRQYIYTDKYTGFTKKGIRMSEETFERFILVFEEKLASLN